MSSLSDWLDDFDFYSDLIDPLIDGGWFEFVFPFLLVYAIIITILNNVPMFEHRKPVRVIIAIVVSLFSVAFEITDDGITLGEFLMTLFPGVTAFSLGILALYIVAAMLGVNLMDFFGKNAWENKWLKYALGGIGVLVVAYYYAKGFGWDGWDGSELEDFFEDPLLYILIVAGLVFYFLTKDDTDELDEQVKHLYEEYRDKHPDMSPGEARRRARRDILKERRDHHHHGGYDK